MEYVVHSICRLTCLHPPTFFGYVDQLMQQVTEVPASLHFPPNVRRLKAYFLNSLTTFTNLPKPMDISFIPTLNMNILQNHPFNIGHLKTNVFYTLNVFLFG